MIFRRYRQKQQARNISSHLRLRVESCVSTVLDLNLRLGEGKIKPEVVRQFERLRESLRLVNDDSVDETDIDRIEEATNQLLAEIRVNYGESLAGLPREGRTH